MGMIYNLIYGTKPIFIHNPGRKITPVWNSLFEKIKILPITDNTLKNCLILTWNTTEKKSPLEISLDKFNCQYQTLGKGIKNWLNPMKMGLACEALENTDSEYVIGLDAFDVLCITEPSEIIDRFKEFNCKMLFNAGSVWFPSIREDFKLFEESIAGSNSFPYINAGMWIGYTKFVKEFLKTAIQTPRIPEHKIWDTSEQIYIKSAFKNYYPETMLDYSSKIFQIVNVVNHNHVKMT